MWVLGHKSIKPQGCRSNRSLKFIFLSWRDDCRAGARRGGFQTPRHFSILLWQLGIPQIILSLLPGRTLLYVPGRLPLLPSSCIHAWLGCEVIWWNWCTSMIHFWKSWSIDQKDYKNHKPFRNLKLSFFKIMTLRIYMYDCFQIVKWSEDQDLRSLNSWLAHLDYKVVNLKKEANFSANFSLANLLEYENG